MSNKVSDIKEQALNKIFSKMAMSKLDINSARNMAGFWWQKDSDPEFIEMKERHINFAKRQHSIYKYIYKLIKNDIK